MDSRIDLISDGIANEFYQTQLRRIIAEKASKFVQGQEPAPEGHFYFFPLQLIDDSVQKLARFKMLDAAATAVKLAYETKQRLVFKRHPLCKSNEVENFLLNACDGEQIILLKSSVHDLIAGSIGVITVNSGVGFEALLHLKHVGSRQNATTS